MSNAIYQRLQQAAKKIDHAESAVLAAAICGVPRNIYSYRLRKNISIGTETHGTFGAFWKQRMNDWREYIQPSNQESIAPSMQSILSSYQQQQQNDDAESPQEVQCAEIELLSRLVDQLQTHRNDSRTEPKSVLFEPVPLDTLQDITWKHSLLLQHPMSVHSEHDDAPLAAVTLDIIDNHFNSLILNQKTLASVNDITLSTDVQVTVDAIKTEVTVQTIKTEHGFTQCPSIFHKHPVYLGGQSALDTTHVLSTSPYCKGTPVMGGAMYWNPDLVTAERLIEKEHCSLDQFRFFQGSMRWNPNLLSNMLERNMFAAFKKKRHLSSQALETLIDAIWREGCKKNQDYQWNNILTHAPSDWYAWLQLQKMMRQSAELKELKNIQQQIIGKQIEHWKQNQAQ